MIVTSHISTVRSFRGVVPLNIINNTATWESVGRSSSFNLEIAASLRRISELLAMTEGCLGDYERPLIFRGNNDVAVRRS
jgi:hypothetical protein